MSPALHTILKELRARLEELYGERLEKLVLYGSQARGDAEPDSDIDVLVVLRGEVSLGEEIGRNGRIFSELSLAHEVVLSPWFVSSREYAARSNSLMVNVHQEGISL